MVDDEIGFLIAQRQLQFDKGMQTHFDDLVGRIDVSLDIPTLSIIIRSRFEQADLAVWPKVLLQILPDA